ncbi:MAG: hypothetical protein RPU41_03205 [Candidatus Sedimenticola sp. (ex Thyasira tokunagai)]
MKKKSNKRRSRAKGIAETYMHIKDLPESLTKDEARLYLQKNIHIWADKNFKNKVFIKISVEDGSLIVRVLVGGLALANLIAVYGSIRGGIDYLVKDSRNFSGTVIENFKKDAHIQDQSIIRAERRLGVPGKIQRFYKKLDKLNSTEYSHNQRQDMIDDLKEEVISIVELIDTPQDRGLFIAEVPDLLASHLNSTVSVPNMNSIYSVNTRVADDESFIVLSPGLPAPSNPPFPAPNVSSNIDITIRNEDDE